METKAGKIAGIVASLALLVTAGLIFMRDDNKGKIEQIKTQQQSVAFYCAACQKTGEVKINMSQQWPMRCPLCGKDQAQRAMKCVCGQYIQQFPGQEFNCPHCHKHYDWRVPSGEEKINH